ncbi:MAG: hypothetical protein E6X13_05800 [Corynebacterium sp.]|nr:hypothetical protein [Corynebacterium sp.]
MAQELVGGHGAGYRADNLLMAGDHAQLQLIARGGADGGGKLLGGLWLDSGNLLP